MEDRITVSISIGFFFFLIDLRVMPRQRNLERTKGLKKKRKKRSNMVKNIQLTCDKQNAKTYIVNMIVGSYFMKSKQLKGSYLIDYSLMKFSEQIKEEKDVIFKMDHLKNSVFSDLKYSLIIKKHQKNVFLWFRTGFEEIICSINPKGRITDFQCVMNYSSKDFISYTENHV